ncbi:MAG TPA: VWA domain-containing protein [Bryobacteraceae bacterium]|nr:VWA domain-containing protein [Bryobacteraceae bacterium]
MRIAVVALLTAVLIAQEKPLRTTTRLVVAPVSVTDRQGRPIESLNASDLVVYDNDVAVPAQVEDVLQPLSLAVVIQATGSAQSSLDKLRKETSLLGPLLIGDRGEAAVIAFAREVRVLQEFTGNVEKVESAIRELDAFGDGGSLVDAIATSMRMLERRPASRRRAILLISETHDRGSAESLEALVKMAERVNATLYALTFSPLKSKLANRAPVHCDYPERPCRRCTCGNCAKHCDRADPEKPVPSNIESSGGLLSIFVELKRKTQPDVPRALAALSGGATWEFLRKSGLEAALQRIGEDLHHHYTVTFPMARTQPGSFHKIRVEVRGRRNAVTRTRSGYYELADE